MSESTKSLDAKKNIEMQNVEKFEECESKYTNDEGLDQVLYGSYLDKSLKKIRFR